MPEKCHLRSSTSLQVSISSFTGLAITTPPSSSVSTHLSVQYTSRFNDNPILVDSARGCGTKKLQISPTTRFRLHSYYCLTSVQGPPKELVNMSDTPLSRSVEYISDIIREHDFSVLKQPLIIGLSGPQGSGKSYLTSHLAPELLEKFPQLKIIQFSMDDLYLTHEEQSKLTIESAKEDNKLLQGRGLPGTHDLKLCVEIFKQLNAREQEVKIPFYDKSLFNGEGDRAATNRWTVVDGKVDVVLFEGWFNGFQALPADVLRAKYLTSDVDHSVLKKHRLYHLESINETLKQYENVWALFNYFIYIKTESVQDVYVWRLQQEHNLKQATGMSMTDDQVKVFVDRYMPVYELCYAKMCERGCIDQPGHNLELLIDVNRKLLGSTIH